MIRSTAISSLLLLALLVSVTACQEPKPKTEEPPVQEEPQETAGVTHPEWSKNAVIYEVNIRQYSPEGDLGGVVARLPELKKMGVDILWLMPIHPIGELNRKGGKGSYYSVKDYKGINPEFGTMEEFKSFVKLAHSMDMKVILDWVANHTAWDNPLTEEHPDWYNKDSLGNFQPPVADWSDVIDLNYDNEEFRAYMIDALKFWVEEADIDGYRCDVAMMVPTDFWNDARKALDEVKPVFMLAEAEQADLHETAFDMGYAWEFHHLINEVSQGKISLARLDTHFMRMDTIYPHPVYRMNFTSNHDENSWNGTVTERMGDAQMCMAKFTYLVPGMPLVYSGQEAGLNKRLAFFEKDEIEWNDSPYRELYTKLNAFKKANEAVWNGPWGAPMERLKTSSDETVYALKRAGENNTVVAVFNFSGEPSSIDPAELGLEGEFQDAISEEMRTFAAGTPQTYGPWEAGIYVVQ